VLKDLRQAMSPSHVGENYGFSSSSSSSSSTSTAIVPTTSHADIVQLLQALLHSQSTAETVRDTTHALSFMATDPEVACTVAKWPNLLERLLGLLAAPNASASCYFVTTLTMLNTLLQHETPGLSISREIVQRKAVPLFVQTMLHHNVKDIALSGMLTLLNISSHEEFRKDVCRTIVQTAGAMDVIQSLLVNPAVVRSTSTVLNLLYNLLIPCQHQKEREDWRPSMTNISLFDQPAQMASNKHFVNLMPQLLTLAENRDGSACRTQAIVLLEQLVQYGGKPLWCLVHMCPASMDRLFELLSWSCGFVGVGGVVGSYFGRGGASATKTSTDTQCLISLVSVIAAIFGAYHAEPVGRALELGGLDLLCRLAEQHDVPEVRRISLKAMSNLFVFPDQDVVSPILLSPQCAVLPMLVGKCSGDRSQSVREQAALGMVQLGRCDWITDAMRNSIVTSFCPLLSNGTTSTHVLTAVLGALLETLQKFPSMYPMFESLSGIDAVGKMLYAGTAPPEVESVLVKILNIQSEREEEGNEMEMDEEMKPLSAVFGMLDENGRLW